MARSQLTVTDVTRAGVAQPAQQSSDAANNHYVAAADNDGLWIMEVTNNNASTQTVTVVANPNLSTDGLTVSDYTLSLTTGQVKVAGPFRPNTFKQPSDGNKVYINPSVTTDLKFRLYAITPAT